MVEENIPSPAQVIAVCRANQAGNDGSVCVGAHTPVRVALISCPLAASSIQRINRSAFL